MTRRGIGKIHTKGRVSGQIVNRGFRWNKYTNCASRLFRVVPNLEGEVTEELCPEKPCGGGHACVKE